MKISLGFPVLYLFYQQRIHLPEKEILINQKQRFFIKMNSTTDYAPM